MGVQIALVNQDINSHYEWLSLTECHILYPLISLWIYLDVIHPELSGCNLFWSLTLMLIKKIIMIKLKLDWNYKIKGVFKLIILNLKQFIINIS